MKYIENPYQVFYLLIYYRFIISNKDKVFYHISAYGLAELY